MCRAKDANGLGGRRCPGKSKNHGVKQERTRGVSTAAGLVGGLGREEQSRDRSVLDGRGHRISHRNGTRLIGGHQVKIVGTYQPPIDRAEILSGRGLSTPTLYELDPSESATFRDSIGSLKVGNKYSASVHVYELEEYAKMRLFIADDGKAGIALKNNDDIVSVFSRKDSEYNRCGQSLVATAISAGGRRLDCYDTALPALYATEGFVPVARMKWDEEYAPEGWKHDIYSSYNEGHPDVVFMKYDPAAIDTSYRLLNDETRGQYIFDYDEGIRRTA